MYISMIRCLIDFFTVCNKVACWTSREQSSFIPRLVLWLRQNLLEHVGTEGPSEMPGEEGRGGAQKQGLQERHSVGFPESAGQSPKLKTASQQNIRDDSVGFHFPNE